MSKPTITTPKRKMTMDNPLKNTVCLNACGVADKMPILAAGPLTKQPGTRAYRVVLVSRGGELVVYNQHFPDFTDMSRIDLLPSEHSYFETGSYFADTELVKATQAFAKRIADHAETLASCYRTDAAPAGKTCTITGYLSYDHDAEEAAPIVAEARKRVVPSLASSMVFVNEECFGDDDICGEISLRFEGGDLDADDISEAICSLFEDVEIER